MFTTRHYKKPKTKAGPTRGISVGELAQKFADAAAPTKIDEEFMAGLATANQQNLADDPSSVPDASALENLLSTDDAAGEARFEDQLLALLAAGTITPREATQRRSARLKEATEKFEAALDSAVKSKQITKTEALAIKRERRTALAQLSAHQRTAEAVRGTKAAVEQARDAQIAATDNATAAVRGSIKEGKTNAREIVRAVRDSINETVQSRGEAAAHHAEVMHQAHRLHDDVRDMKTSAENTVDEVKGMRADQTDHTETLGKHLAKIRSKLSDVKESLEAGPGAPARAGSRSSRDAAPPPTSFMQRVAGLFSPGGAADDDDEEEPPPDAAQGDEFRTYTIHDFTDLWTAGVNKATKLPLLSGTKYEKALAEAATLAAKDREITRTEDGNISILMNGGDIEVSPDEFRDAVEQLRKSKTPGNNSVAQALLDMFSAPKYVNLGITSRIKNGMRIPAAGIAEEDEGAAAAADPTPPRRRGGRRAQSEPPKGGDLPVVGGGLPVVGGGLPVVGGDLPVVGGTVGRKKRSAPPATRPSPDKRREIADVLLETAQTDLMAARDLLLQTRAKGVWPHNEYSALATELVEEQKRQHYGKGLPGKPKNLRLRMPLERIRQLEPHLLL